MKRNPLILTFFLAAVFLVLRGVLKMPEPPERIRAREEKIAEGPERSKPFPGNTKARPFDDPQAHENAKPLRAVAEEGEFVRKVISSEWTDPVEKAAGRRRVRIVEANFKYPKLRLEESVATDPQTGKESVTLLSASVANRKASMCLSFSHPRLSPVRTI